MVSDLVDQIRPLVLVVDRLGLITQARGGYGGFFAHDNAALVGTPVLDIVAPEDQEMLLSHFVASLGDAVDVTELPMPFRLRMIGGNGSRHVVDVIPTALPDDPTVEGWVAVLVPQALQVGVQRPLEAFLGGADRDEVRRLLASELENPAGTYRLAWLHLTEGDDGWTAVVPDPAQADLAEEVCGVLQRNPPALWDAAPEGAIVLLSVDELPGALPEKARGLGFLNVWFVAERMAGRRVCLLGFARVSSKARASNIVDRIERVQAILRLAMEHWRSIDDLVTAVRHDDLTGLATRQTFAESLRLSSGPHTVLYIDIDRFKNVNDRYGHDVGDAVLTAVVDRLTLACRSDDLVARIGGDEFAVLLRDVGEGEDEAIANRIIADVGRRLSIAGGPERVSVSVGLARCAMQTGEGDDEVVRAADHAMLEAKRRGRGRLFTSA